MDVFDTRATERTDFEPWMLGRFVEISTHASNGWVRKYAGKLETYSSTPDGWTWRFKGASNLYERTKVQASHAAYSTMGTRGSARSIVTVPDTTFTISVVVMVPNNWDHYGVDGREETR